MPKRIDEESTNGAPADDVDGPSAGMLGNFNWLQTVDAIASR